MFMDPEQLAKECKALAEELGIEVQIYDKKQAEEMTNLFCLAFHQLITRTVIV